MIEPADLNLRYTDWRPGQWDAIMRAATSTARYVVIEAPVGAGKSGIALGFAHAICAGQALILTSTKQLGTQYLGITNAILEVRGRQNFVCTTHPMLMADRAPCTRGSPCIYAHIPEDGSEPLAGCAYLDQKRAAQAAPEVVTNYSYILAQLNYVHGFAPEILICDEAHAVEDHVRQFVTVELRGSTIDRLGLPWPRRAKLDWQRWHAWAVKYQDFHLPPKGDEDYQVAQNLRFSLRLLAEHLDEDWLLRPLRDAGGSVLGIELQPVWVDRLVPQYLLRHAEERVVFMSATVRPLELFCQQLGIDPAETEFIEVPSTFPKASRPLIYRPIGRVKRGDTAVLDKLVAAVDDIFDAHPNEKGLVHTVSYELCRYLLEHSRYARRMLTHTSQNRDQVIAAFKETSTPRVLVSPSVSTGLDLPYDECRFQVIMKLPFPSLGDEQVQRRMKDGPDGKTNPRGQAWYRWATACTLIQMYGRGMRASDDACVTYLLDEGFGWFRAQNREAFPAWFTEAIRTESPKGKEVSRTTDVHALINAFRPPTPQGVPT
jgi:ATP-dependent DNA helicase DinG